MKSYSHLLENTDVKCLYVSPKKLPESAKFLEKCWNDENVTPNMFVQALSDGYFEKYLVDNSDLEVFVLTENILKLFINGSVIPISADKYPELI